MVAAQSKTEKNIGTTLLLELGMFETKPTQNAYTFIKKWYLISNKLLITAVFNQPDATSLNLHFFYFVEQQSDFSS